LTNGKSGSAKRLLFIAAILISAGVFSFAYHQLFLSDKFLPGVSIDSISLEGCTVEQAADKLQLYLEDAQQIPVCFYSNDYRYRTVLGDLSEPVDVRRAVEETFQADRKRDLLSRVCNLDGPRDIPYPLNIHYDSAVQDKLLQDWNETLGKDAIDAQLEMDSVEGLIIIPEVIGQSVDMSATFKQLPGRWRKIEPVQVKIVIAEKVPLVSSEDLKIMGELASYDTWYRVYEVDRTHNLSRATWIVNGTMVAPGEEFSFNKTVGPRTQTTGFRDALVIVGNKLEPGIGGGICQVSSTLYNACLLAGMEIVERHNHGLAVSYVPLGMDATVAYGLQDFRFKNNTDYPIYIRSVADGGKLTVNIYGHLSHKKKIETSHVVDQIIPFEYLEEIDPELQAGESRIDHAGFPGYIVRSFRTFYDESEEVLISEFLARDVYKPFAEITYIAPPEISVPDDPIGPPIEPGEETGEGAVGDDPVDEQGDNIEAEPEDSDENVDADADNDVQEEEPEEDESGDTV